jgi:hypothetical protein
MLVGLLTLFGVLVVIGILLIGIVVTIMAHGILRPPRMTDGKAIYRLHRLAPDDLGLAFENESFTVCDARTSEPLRLAGWWIPHPDAAGRCAILLHGYADAKVGAIAFAPLLHRLGLNILAIDLRAHGESGGVYCTGGYFERDDVSQVIDQLLAARPNDAKQVVLFGVSLGAAVAAAVAERRDDLAAVVLESPFTDYRRAVAAHSQMIGLPSGPMLRLALRLAEMICGAKFDAVRPIQTIPQIRCPVLVSLGGQDEMLDETDRSALAEAVRRRPVEYGPAKLITSENAIHIGSMHVDPENYAAEMRAFLSATPTAGQSEGTPERRPAFFG